METTDRLFFAFMGAVVAAWIFSQLWGKWHRHRLIARLPAHLKSIEGSELEELEEVCRRVAAGVTGCVLTGPAQFQLLHRGVKGRCDFISDKTEIRMETGSLIQQVVEVVPAGIWTSGQRARGSRNEYDRIFRQASHEAILFNMGAAYELRFSPDGLTLRIHSLPGSAAALSHWIGSVFRLVDLIPGVDVLGHVEVTDVRFQVADDSACQVCGAPLSGAPIVRCEKCRTPHHAECWDYAKKCSTFGCQSDRCLR